MNLNGVEMEVLILHQKNVMEVKTILWPPFRSDYYIDNPTTFNTKVFTQPPPPWALLFRTKWKTV